MLVSFSTWVQTDSPCFRSEFASIARLWHEQYTLDQAQFQKSETTPERQTYVDFLTYDDVLTASIKLFDDRNARAIGMLRHALEKALVRRYGLDTDQVRRLTREVIERHLQEAYNTGFCW